jgi:hypothetical protein
MVTRWASFVVLFATSLIASLALTPVARRIAWKVGSVDFPGGRRINQHPLPRMGGIAVFASLFIGLAITIALKEALGLPGFTTASILPIPGTQKSIDYVRLSVAFICVFATGIIDDLVSLRPRQKFLGQLAAAAIAVSSGLTIDIVVNPFTNGALDLSWLGWPLTALYLLRTRSLEDVGEEYPLKKAALIASAIALVIGMYDGFYGPGTGTFLILLLTRLAHFRLGEANGVAKSINLTTNLASLAVYLMNGKVILLLGFVAGLCGVAGNYIGITFFKSRGGKAVRPIMLIVLTIFFIRILSEIL